MTTDVITTDDVVSASMVLTLKMDWGGCGQTGVGGGN